MYATPLQSRGSGPITFLPPSNGRLTLPTIRSSNLDGFSSFMPTTPRGSLNARFDREIVSLSTSSRESRSAQNTLKRWNEERQERTERDREAQSRPRTIPTLGSGGPASSTHSNLSVTAKQSLDRRQWLDGLLSGKIQIDRLGDRSVEAANQAFETLSVSDDQENHPDGVLQHPPPQTVPGSSALPPFPLLARIQQPPPRRSDTRPASSKAQQLKKDHNIAPGATSQSHPSYQRNSGPVARDHQTQFEVTSQYIDLDSGIYKGQEFLPDTTSTPRKEQLASAARRDTLQDQQNIPPIRGILKVQNRGVPHVGTSSGSREDLKVRFHPTPEHYVYSPQASTGTDSTMTLDGGVSAQEGRIPLGSDFFGNGSVSLPFAPAVPVDPPATEMNPVQKLEMMAEQVGYQQTYAESVDSDELNLRPIVEVPLPQFSVQSTHLSPVSKTSIMPGQQTSKAQLPVPAFQQQLYETPPPRRPHTPPPMALKRHRNRQTPSESSQSSQSTDNRSYHHRKRSRYTDRYDYHPYKSTPSKTPKAVRVALSVLDEYYLIYDQSPHEHRGHKQRYSRSRSPSPGTSGSYTSSDPSAMSYTPSESSYEPSGEGNSLSPPPARVVKVTDGAWSQYDLPPLPKVKKPQSRRARYAFQAAKGHQANGHTEQSHAPNDELHDATLDEDELMSEDDEAESIQDFSEPSQETPVDQIVSSSHAIPSAGQRASNLRAHHAQHGGNAGRRIRRVRFDLLSPVDEEMSGKEDQPSPPSKSANIPPTNPHHSIESQDKMDQDHSQDANDRVGEVARAVEEVSFFSREGGERGFEIWRDHY